MPCKLCLQDDQGFISEKLIVCSRCFQVVARSSQEQIKRAYEKALEKGSKQKADILKKFIINGDSENGELQNKRQKPPRHTAKHFDRRGDLKADWIDKKTTRRLPERKRPPFSEDQQELQAVSGK